MPHVFFAKIKETKAPMENKGGSSAAVNKGKRYKAVLALKRYLRENFKGKSKTLPEYAAVFSYINVAALENFVDMIQKINAMHLCYEAPKAITVCSGLDGHCYINYEIISLQFDSYDGECHTVPLSLRVNRNTDIELLLSRKTVNKYDFMSSIPFAFGISPELSAENKRKRNTRLKKGK